MRGVAHVGDEGRRIVEQGRIYSQLGAAGVIEIIGEARRRGAEKRWLVRPRAPIHHDGWQSVGRVGTIGERDPTIGPRDLLALKREVDALVHHRQHPALADIALNERKKRDANFHDARRQFPPFCVGRAGANRLQQQLDIGDVLADVRAETRKRANAQCAPGAFARADEPQLRHVFRLLAEPSFEAVAEQAFVLDDQRAELAADVVLERDADARVVAPGAIFLPACGEGEARTLHDSAGDHDPVGGDGRGAGRRPHPYTAGASIFVETQSHRLASRENRQRRRSGNSLAKDAGEIGIGQPIGENPLDVRPRFSRRRRKGRARWRRPCAAAGPTWRRRGRTTREARVGDRPKSLVARDIGGAEFRQLAAQSRPCRQGPSRVHCRRSNERARRSRCIWRWTGCQA